MVPLKEVLFQPGEPVDHGDRVVIVLQRRGQILRPRELRAVEVDERVGGGDVYSEVPVRRPAVTELPHVDRVLEARVVARDLIRPVIEGEEGGVAGVEPTGSAVCGAGTAG